MQQHAAEFDQLLALYQERQPARVLEIGVYEGGTLFQWLQGCPDVIPQLVVAVDAFTMASRHTWLPVWPTWANAGTDLRIVEGRSDNPDTIRQVTDLAPFDWVFIDADHSYQAVRADWDTYRPLCTGVIAFHDILPPSPNYPEIQVSRLWAQIKAAGYRTVELIADPDASWGGIGVVFLDEGIQDAAA